MNRREREHLENKLYLEKKKNDLLLIKKRLVKIAEQQKLLTDKSKKLIAELGKNFVY